MKDTSHEVESWEFNATVELLQVEKELQVWITSAPTTFFSEAPFIVQALIKSKPCCYVLYTSSIHPSRKRTL